MRKAQKAGGSMETYLTIEGLGGLPQNRGKDSTEMGTEPVDTLPEDTGVIRFRLSEIEKWIDDGF